MTLPEYTPAQLKAYWRRVKRTRKCWLWTGIVNRDGYGRYNARINGRTVNRSAHRIAWELIYGPIPDGLQVRHKCPGGGNRLCCNPAHLALGNAVQNAQDREDDGRTARGERNGRHTRPESFGEEYRARVRARPSDKWRGEAHPAAKLTEEQVRAIRQRREAGEELLPLSTEFGVTRAMICAIAKRRAWKHVA